MHNFIQQLSRHIQMFLESPKDYIYSYTASPVKKVHIQKYDPQTHAYGLSLVKKIRSIIPQTKVHYLGSSSLGIDGENDIDIFVEYEPGSFHQTLTLLKKIITYPYKLKKGKAEWHYTYKGISIDILLIDSHNPKLEEQLTIYRLLHDYPFIQNAYIHLKYRLDGKSMREYSRAKISFFNALRNFRTLSDSDKTVFNNVSTIGFPKRIGKYIFIKQLNTINTHTLYSYALYKDRLNKLFFAKLYIGNPNSKNYGELKNEVMAYRFFSLSKNTSGVTKVFIPALRFSCIHQSKILLLIDYVKGQTLQQYSLKYQHRVIDTIQKYLNGYDVHGWLKPKIFSLSMTKCFIFLVPITLLACLKNLSHSAILIKSMILIIKLLPYTYNRDLKLVHRDLGFWNILINKNKIIMYDFQLASLANSQMDKAIYLLKTYNYKDQVKVRNQIADIRKSGLLKMYTLFVGILDTIYGNNKLRFNTISLLTTLNL